VLPAITSGVKCVVLQKERKKVRDTGWSTPRAIPPLEKSPIANRISSNTPHTYRSCHIYMASGTLSKKFRSLRGPRRSPGPLFQAPEDPAALPDEQTMATSNDTQTSTRHRRLQSTVFGGYTKQDAMVLHHDPGISVDYSRKRGYWAASTSAPSSGSRVCLDRDAPFHIPVTYTTHRNYRCGVVRGIDSIISQVDRPLASS